MEGGPFKALDLKIIHFYLVRKSEVLDLKTVFSDFSEKNLICELILVLVSLWLLINSFKETSKEKRSIDFFYYFYIVQENNAHTKFHNSTLS